MNKMWNVDRTDEEWRSVLAGWSEVDLLHAYRQMSVEAYSLPSEKLLHHALWCVEGALLERMRSKAQWVDGYTSALANALDADFIDDDEYDDLYEEVLGVE